MKYTQKKQSQGKKLMETLITKSWENNSFKDKLVNNPETTIESLVGDDMMIPKGKRIIVEDQTDQSVIYLNIPAQINIDDFELNEEQLETISGGAICGGLCVAATIVGGIAAGAQIIEWFGEGWNSYE